MKKLLSVIIFNLVLFSIFPDEGFFIHNRDGILIKVDVASGVTLDYPEKKGPGPEDVPETMGIEEFEKEYVSKITDEKDFDFINEVYLKDEQNGIYVLKNDLVPGQIPVSVVKSSVLGNLNVPEKKYLNKFYKKKTGYYILKNTVNYDDQTLISQKLVPFIARGIFLYYNKDNEMETGLDKYGAPSPHRFPRIFNAKTQGAIDIQFCWGYKFEDPADPNINATLEFSVSLTNFVMPSLEILVKHNFVLPDNPTISPYIGGVLYGGFLDGFPIGLSFLGGTDIFPDYYRNGTTNFYLLAEARLGAVFFSRQYFDTGSNSDGIWKKLGVLAEGGFYFGTGYRWDKKN